MTPFHLEFGRLCAGLHRYLCRWEFLWGAEWVLTPASVEGGGVEAFTLGPGFYVLSLTWALARSLELGSVASGGVGTVCPHTHTGRAMCPSEQSHYVAAVAGVYARRRLAVSAAAAGSSC